MKSGAKRVLTMILVLWSGLAASLQAADMTVDGAVNMQSANIKSASGYNPMITFSDSASSYSNYLFAFTNASGTAGDLAIGGGGAVHNMFLYTDNQWWTSQALLTLTTDQKVGIACSPAQALDVNGKIQIRGANMSSVTNPSTNNGWLYANYNASYDPPGSYSGAGVYVAYGTTHNRISSHADPRGVDPQAVTSFGDPSVQLPFSFSHWDTVVGKGQVVDMAKMVAWVEKKMQAEQGEQNGRLVFNYDLPANLRVSLEDYNKKLAEDQAAAVIQKLDSMPLIKVNVGGDGKIPAEAFESVPVYTTVTRKVTKKVKEVNCDTMQLVAVDREEEVKEQVATGQTKRQLRKDWRLIDGELYRRPTVNDIDVDAVVKECPKLPAWILERIKSGKQVSMDVKTLSEQIRKILASKETAGQDHLSAQANP